MAVPNKKPLAGVALAVQPEPPPPPEDDMPALFATVLFENGTPSSPTLGTGAFTLGVEPENFADPSLLAQETLRGAMPTSLIGGQTLRAASGPEGGDVTNLGTAIPGVTAAFGGPIAPFNNCNLTIVYDGDPGLVAGSIQGTWKGIPVIVFIDLIVP